MDTPGELEIRQGSEGYDSLQHALNLSRVKRLGNEGHAAQVRRQLFCPK
jgi:hypothetical protein